MDLSPRINGDRYICEFRLDPRPTAIGEITRKMTLKKNPIPSPSSFSNFNLSLAFEI